MSTAKDQIVAAQREQTRKTLDIMNEYDRIEQQRDKLLKLFKRTIHTSEGYISRNILIEIKELIAEIEGKNG